MTPRYGTAAAFALLFGGLIGMLVVAANTGDAKNTGDLTAEEIYARYLEQTADLTFLVERRHTVLVDPLSGTIVLEDSRDVLWDIRRNHPGNQKLFINFPCNCLDEGYPVAIELLGLEEIEGRKLIHLFITDPNRQYEPGSPETIVVWQDLYLNHRTFEPVEIVTHIDQYRDGSLGARYTQLRTSVSRIFSRQLLYEPGITR